MRAVKKIVLHCSASAWGDVLVIDKWHRNRKRPFRCIGYHYIITNGRPHGSAYIGNLDGETTTGRPEREIGAHVKHGHNKDSIGICMIGIDKFTFYQFYALRNLIIDLLDRHSLMVDDVFMHYELQKNKTCPNMDGDTIRAWLLDDLVDVSQYEKAENACNPGKKNQSRKR